MRKKTTFKFWFVVAAALLLLMPGFMAKASGGDVPRTFPLTEDFEAALVPPAGWNIYDVDGLGTNWAASYFNHTSGGQYSAYHGYAPDQHDGWIVTPALSFPASGQIVLSFWSLIVDPSFYGKNSVLISTASGDPAIGNFVEIWTPTNVGADWSQVVLNLQAYAGQTAYLAFRYEGNYAHGWAIDDVYVGGDFNTSPVIAVNPEILNATAPINTTVSKNLTVTNTGVDNLAYTFTITYEGTAANWLSITPMTGDVAGGGNLVHSASFNPSGLELGTYTASIAIASNDPETPVKTIPVNFTVVEPSSVAIYNMIQTYTFPYDISENGEYVAISGFGTGGWLWSKTNGLIPVNGEEVTVQAVAEDGVISGTARNPAYNISGMGVFMAGYWHPVTQDWTFLGVNPAAGEPVFNDYSSSWGMTSDGSTVVGMQYFNDYSYKAFKWTQAGGFDMIGNVIPTGNRPNGISNDGSVIFGWAELPEASRSPVIWHNGNFIQIAPTQWGEASAASSNGEYVVGTAGSDAFIWSAQNGATFFPNTLNGGGISPVAVMDDGTALGYTAEGWPPFPDTRRGFARLITGEMMTFNDYAISRGMIDAADWLFYSINGVTPDGNKFIGAGINPDGVTVSFLIDFGASIPSIEIIPTSLTENLDPGESSTQNLTINNTGNVDLEYDLTINFNQGNKKSVASIIPVGPRPVTTGMKISSKETNGINTLTEKSRETFVLNYDGTNVDAIGLISGGTFYNAVRFPADLTTPFAGASINSIDVYINNLPGSATLLIWEGGTTTTPGTLIHEQIITPTATSWNTITLASPVVLDGSDVWVGFTYTHDAGLFVAGIDGGPLNDNGDFLSADGLNWERLSDYGFVANWNIRANLELGSGNWLSVSPLTGSVPAEGSQDVVVSFDATTLNNGLYNATIIVRSNDPDMPLAFVPASLLVGSEIPCFPSPRNLTGTTQGQDVTLAWQAPDFSGGGGGTTQDFEEGFEAGTLPTGWMT
ncbi:MAG: Uncharacterized protein FD155_2352, partial [Bacteroidetes bacterium]